jgi:hypothetical protein
MKPPFNEKAAGGDHAAHQKLKFEDNELVSDEQYKTDKSDITDFRLSNVDFIAAVFGSLEDEVKPVIVSKAGNPKATKGYPCKPWLGDDSIIPAAANNFFSLARFRPDQSDVYKRQKPFFVSLHAFVLDDIGEKVPPDDIKLPPSWQLETSSGNFHYGYILSEPLTDQKIIKQLEDAIIEAGLSDTGMNGYTTRLARLPVGINGKHSPPFQCRLHDWQPDRRYTVAEICEGLGISPAPKEKTASQKQKENAQKAYDSALFTPAPSDNPVIVALQHRGLYRRALDAAKHDITCPWVHEHTDQVDNGTAYFAPNDDFPIGGFKCQHGHCSERKISDLLKFLGIDAAEAKMKPILRIRAGDLHKMADQAEKVLAETKRFYQRGGMVVSVIREQDTEKTIIKPDSRESLKYALAMLIEWQRYTPKGYMTADPDGQVIGILHNHNEYRFLPALAGLAHQPFLREDHTLVMRAGYDSASRIYGVFDPSCYRNPSNPTKADAGQAIQHIEGLLEDFCFASDIDKSAALAAILTAACRPSMPTAPMFHVRAPMIGSGKSYLCELIGAFASDQTSSPCAFPGDEEECRKLLLSSFLTAPPVIEFDNLTGDIKAHKSLCTALTSGRISDRVLGVSKTAEVSTRSLILSSGNNVSPINDMVRRCVTITLDTGEEIPAIRTYKNPDLMGHVREQRERYVSAALTVILAWLQSGEKAPDCKSLGSYSAWSKLCRYPLLWLGYADPVESMLQAMQEDPERETLGQLMELWDRQYGDIPKKVRDLLDGYGGASEELREIFVDIAGERGSVNRRRLGHYLKQHANRPVNGLKLLRSGGKSNSVQWRVVKTEKKSV